MLLVLHVSIDLKKIYFISDIWFLSNQKKDHPPLFSPIKQSQDIDDPGNSDTEPKSANIKENDEVCNLTQVIRQVNVLTMHNVYTCLLTKFQEEAAVQNKLLKILDARQCHHKKAQKTFVTSAPLNGIIDLTDDNMYKEVTASLSEDETVWLQNFLQRKVWKPISQVSRLRHPIYGEIMHSSTDSKPRLQVSCRQKIWPGIPWGSWHRTTNFYPSVSISCMLTLSSLLYYFLSLNSSIRLEAPMRVE